jgi:ankyrin repeat protein
LCFLKAAYKGLPEVIAILIYFGLNAKRCDNYGQTVLHLASINGSLDAVKQLIGHVNIKIKYLNEEREI